MFTKAILCLAIVISALLLINSCVQAQTPQIGGFNQTPLPKLKFPEGKSFVEVPFEAEGNWVVIPVSINGSRPLRFVFDSGASGTVLFNSAIADSLNLKFTGTRQARGAGGGGATFEVKVAEDVNFNIGGIELSNGSLSQRPSNRTSVDGVIGRVVFATTVVEIDWEKRVVKFYEPSKYKYSGSGAVLPLTFDGGGRPYANAAVSVSGEKAVPVKLVVDTGGGHALFLELGSGAGIKPPDGATKTILGRGASGDITGFTGRVKDFQLGKYSVKDVPTGFPDASGGTANLGGRDGNLGSGVLRRFKVIYDYSRKQMIVEPNKFISEPFAVPTTATVAANNNAAATTNVSPAVLQDYVGRYGERTISSEGGALFIQRPGGQKLKMVAAAEKDNFTLEQVPAAQIKFIRDGAGSVTEVQVLNREGQWEKSKKDMVNQPTGQPQKQAELSQAEREVRKLEREWLDAYENRDAEAMNRIVADDFKLTRSDGSVQTKADILAQIKAAKESGRPASKFSTEDVQSRVEGDTVILTGRYIQQSERGKMQFSYTDTYVKRNGRWQVIESKPRRIPQPQNQNTSN